jgi:hypothetical protein
MTLERARECIGRLVVYCPPHDWSRPSEEGVITSVNDRYVFVRYGSQQTPAATRPEDLELVAGGLG